MRIVTAIKKSDFLQIKPSTLYSWFSSGSIPHFRLNGVIRFDLDELKQWLLFSRTVEQDIRPITIEEGTILIISNSTRGESHKSSPLCYRATALRPASTPHKCDKSGMTGGADDNDQRSSIIDFVQQRT